ncbi:MAG TPA: type I-U CRISPR-associated protein Csb2 [Kofleriaceae bacterium]|jgi:CRISPR-associated protein Csb2|nr:type I-U CRISPR-associated protein Csb2 [Kofleriaceae bacterium]
MTTTESAAVEPADGQPAWPAHRSGDARAADKPVTAVRFALSAVRRPSLVDALAVGDCARKALLRYSDGHPVFSGYDAVGQVMRGAQHDHAWFLPADDDGDGAIDHLLVYARGGFDLAALRALVGLRRLWGYGVPAMSMTLGALGSPDELGCVRSARSGTHTSQLGTATVWESLTPFIPPRHIRHRANGVRDAPHQQVARLLGQHGRPPARIEPLAPEQATPPRSRPIAWEHFQRRRLAGGGSRGADVALGFRLIFEEPVTGPIALGYAAHQGLGQFIAVA